MSASCGVVTTHMAAPSFWPEALPAVTVDSGFARDDDVGCAAFTGHSDRDQLVGEPAGIMGGDRTVVGPDREFVLVLAADPVVATQVLGCLDHASAHRMTCAAWFRGLGLVGPAVRCRLDARRCAGRVRSARRSTSTRHHLRRRRGPLRSRPVRRRTAPLEGRTRIYGRSADRGRRCRGRRPGRRSGPAPGPRRWDSRRPGSRRRRHLRPVLSGRSRPEAWPWPGRLPSMTTAPLPSIRPTGVRTGLQITMSVIGGISSESRGRGLCVAGKSFGDGRDDVIGHVLNALEPDSIDSPGNCAQ